MTKNLEVVPGDSSWHSLLDLSSFSSEELETEEKKKREREREREKEKPWRKNEWTKSRGRQGGVEKFTSAFQRRKEIRCTTVLWRLIIAVIKMRGSCARGRGAN